MSASKTKLIVAVIGSAGLIVAAVITAMLQPAWWGREPNPKADLVIAGTVVDQTSNQAVGQATISVVGRSESYVTEDNGNFRIELRAIPENGRARLHVTKDGYAPYDSTITPPTESLVIPLRRMGGT